jgi:hypothetical protein
MDDDAVGPVVAAVLLFGLITVATTLWTINTLPDWVTERETAHLDDAGGTLLRLREDVEAAAMRGSSTPVVAALDLAPDPVALLQPNAATGRVAFTPAATTFTVDFPAAQVFGGAGGLTGPATGPIPVEYGDVQTLEAFIVTLEALGTSGPKTAWVQLDATDGAKTVRITVAHRDAPSQTGCTGRALHVIIEVVGSGVRFDQGVECGLTNDLDAYQVDLLDDRFKLRTSLAELDAPFEVAATKGGQSLVDAWHAIWWKDSAGVDHTAGGNAQTSDVQFVRTGGDIVYVLDERGLVEQTLALSGGALVAVQPDGAAIVAAPGLTIAESGGTRVLSWTYVQVNGRGETQGGGTASLTAQPAGVTDLLFSASDGTFALDTPHADAWRAFLTDQALLAGVQGDLTIGGDVDTVTLGFATAWTFHIRIVSVVVEVR